MAAGRLTGWAVAIDLLLPASATDGRSSVITSRMALTPDPVATRIPQMPTPTSGGTRKWYVTSSAFVPFAAKPGVNDVTAGKPVQMPVGEARPAPCSVTSVSAPGATAEGEMKLMVGG